MNTAEQNNLADLEEEMARLIQLSLDEPRRALPEIHRLKEVVEATQDEALWIPHLLFFFAQGSLAFQRHDKQKGPPDEKTVALCESALSEYRAALQAGSYEDEEEYQEEVVIKPAGFFRKAQTRTETRTRTVTKYNFDKEDCVQAVDGIAGILERASAGRVHEILGETKIKYYSWTNRILMPQIFQNEIKSGTFSKADLLAIGDLPLQSDGPIRFIAINLMRTSPEPRLIATFFDKENPIGNQSVNGTGSCIMEKRHGEWRVS